MQKTLRGTDARNPRQAGTVAKKNPWDCCKKPPASRHRRNKPPWDCCKKPSPGSTVAKNPLNQPTVRRQKPQPRKSNQKFSFKPFPPLLLHVFTPAGFLKKSISRRFHQRNFLPSAGTLNLNPTTAPATCNDPDTLWIGGFLELGKHRRCVVCNIL